LRRLVLQNVDCLQMSFCSLWLGGDVVHSVSTYSLENYLLIFSSAVLDCKKQHNITNVGIICLLQSCVRLERLDVSGCRGVTEDIIEHFLAAPSLIVNENTFPSTKVKQ
jgi:hypothetical protein